MKTVIITGSARGFGYEMIKLFRHNNFNTVLCDINLEALNSAKEYTNTQLNTFKTDEFTDNIRDIMISTRHRGFPVLNKDGTYEGTVSRRNLL